MAIDKALYEAPQGIEALAVQEPEIEIEIENPDAVTIGMDGLEISLTPEEDTEDEKFEANIADEVDEQTLQSLAGDLIGDYESDLTSRKDWLRTYTDGLKFLGLDYEERTEPWPGACGVFHPLLMESAVKFQAETIMETFPAMGPVKGEIIGKETPEKKAASLRVAADMNYQLTEVMKEYRPEHERMLISLCLSGNAFKKVYFDPALNRQVAMFIPAEDIVVPYGAANIETAERATHRMRKTKNELRRLQVSGFYRDVDLGEPINVMDDVEKQKAKETGLSATVDNRYLLLEMQVECDLSEYGYADEFAKDRAEEGVAVPYIITIDKGTGTILAIRRNWTPEDETYQKRQHIVHYGYIPGFVFYYFGLIHLIGGHARAGTSLMRQLVDAGTLSNLPGGLKARGLRVKGDDTPIAPGEFRDVDVPSGSVRDNIMPLPYKEPSQTLVQLMDKIVEDGRRFAAVAELKISDTSAQAPVGTTLAVLERMLKVMSAVQARIYYSMKQEFRLLRDIIRDNTPDEYNYEPEEGTRKAKKADYDNANVLPVADPNASTMSQRLAQYQAVMQLAKDAPQIYDLPYLHRQMIETLGVKNAAKIVPSPEDMRPVDPVTENMNILMGKPVKAFMYQDHEAHLAVHMAAIQDPKLAATVGQSPQAQAIQGAAMAHVMEHVAMQYRREIEKQLGAALPPVPEEDGEHTLPPEVEVQLSQLAAQAAAKLLQKDQAEAQAQQAQQQQQDPLIQMQQKELEIREKEVGVKEKKLAVDAAARADELDIRRMEAEARIEAENKKIVTNAAAKADELNERRIERQSRAVADAVKQAEKPKKGE